MRPALVACVLALGLALAAPAGAQVSGAVPRPPAPSPRPRPPARKPAPKPAPLAFTIALEQDGAPVEVDAHEAYLHRGPFTLVVTSPDAEGFYLNASLEPALYDLARQGLPLGNAFRTGIVIAESAANADQALFVEPETLHSLRVDDPRGIYMEQWSKAGAGFRGRRTVARLNFGNGKEEPLDALPPRPLHLVAVRGEPDAQHVVQAAETAFLKLHFDEVPAAVRARVEPNLRLLRATDKPLAERARALQELARTPRESILVMDGGAQKQQATAREAAVRGRLLAFVTGEKAYAGTNAGLYDSPDCLTAPKQCNGKSNAAPYAGPAAQGELDGYRHRFHAGAGVDAKEAKRLKASPSSLRGFALSAVPLDPSQGRSLCADDTGRVCVLPEAESPDLDEGRCPQACTPLE